MQIAMILAAGRGERMRPLSDHCPKALLPVLGKPLLFHHLDALNHQGFDRVVINTAYLANQITTAIDNELKKKRWTNEICLVEEKPYALETAGGIVNALPLLEAPIFTVISADIFTDFAYNQIKMPANSLAHLILVDNPDYHPSGDFSLEEDGLIQAKKTRTLTYGNIGLFHRSIFESLSPGIRSLKSVFDDLIEQKSLSGAYYQGLWHNVGRPSDLDKIHLDKIEKG